MSSSLIWELVRNHNSYLVKRKGLRLSSEPFNLLQTHTPKYSGLANFKGVDVQPAKRVAAIRIRKAKYDAPLASSRKTRTVLRKGFKRYACPPL
jgi:large subunit ribosomal protein L28e